MSYKAIRENGEPVMASNGEELPADLLNLMAKVQEGQQLLAIGAPPHEQILCRRPKGSKGLEVGGYFNMQKYRYAIFDIEEGLEGIF